MDFGFCKEKKSAQDHKILLAHVTLLGLRSHKDLFLPGIRIQPHLKRMARIFSLSLSSNSSSFKIRLLKSRQQIVSATGVLNSSIRSQERGFLEEESQSITSRINPISSSCVAGTCPHFFESSSEGYMISSALNFYGNF